MHEAYNKYRTKEFGGIRECGIVHTENVIQWLGAL